MAAVKGVNQTIIDTGGLANQLARGLIDGRVKVCMDTYEATALAAASTISVCGALPSGAKIIDVILLNDALTDVTVTVGDSHTANRYITSTSMASATVTRLNAINGNGYVIGTTAGDTQILITTAGSPATGTLQIAVLYSQD